MDCGACGPARRGDRFVCVHCVRGSIAARRRELVERLREKAAVQLQLEAALRRQERLVEQEGERKRTPDHICALTQLVEQTIEVLSSERQRSSERKKKLQERREELLRGHEQLRLQLRAARERYEPDIKSSRYAFDFQRDRARECCRALLASLFEVADVHKLTLRCSNGREIPGIRLLGEADLVLPDTSDVREYADLEIALPRVSAAYAKIAHVVEVAARYLGQCLPYPVTPRSSLSVITAEAPGPSSSRREFSLALCDLQERSMRLFGEAHELLSADLLFLLVLARRQQLPHHAPGRASGPGPPPEPPDAPRSLVSRLLDLQRSFAVPHQLLSPAPAPFSISPALPASPSVLASASAPVRPPLARTHTWTKISVKDAGTRARSLSTSSSVPPGDELSPPPADAPGAGAAPGDTASPPPLPPSPAPSGSPAAAAPPPPGALHPSPRAPP
eukprot:tig00020629_g12359.t1